MTDIKIKLCGLTDEATVEAAAASGAHYAGFVHFAPSPRHLPLERIGALMTQKLQNIVVLVDPDDTLLANVAALKPYAIQLHGKESPQRIAEIKARHPGLTVIKALRIRSSDDVAAANRYQSADMLLFDARAPEGMLPGGNGLSFDWALLKDRDFGKSWFLSGGLSDENIAEAISASGAKMVDVSSSIESAPGVKDAGLMNRFVKAVAQA